MSSARKRRRARVRKKRFMWNFRKLPGDLQALARNIAKMLGLDLYVALVRARKKLDELTAPPVANGVEK